MSRSNVMPLPIVGSNHYGRYPKISREETVNMIISDNALVPYAGYRQLFPFLNSGNGREIFRSIPFNHLIVVVDDKVFSVSTGLAFSQIGSLVTESGPVYMAENGINQIALVDGSRNVYVFNHADSTFLTIPVDFQAIYITFHDGYFIAADGSSNQFRLSELNNATIFPPTSGFVGVLQTDGDRPQAVIKFRRQLFIMGKNVTDIRHNVGNTLFPYQLDNSLAIEYGILSAATLAVGFDLMVWLAQNRQSGPTIVVSTGGAAVPLGDSRTGESNDGIEFLLDDLRAPEDSSAFLYQENGHIFYQITFRTDNVSFIYDFNTRRFYTVTDENINFHIARRAAFFNNENYFISSKNPYLWQFGTQFTTYNEAPIPRFRISPPIRRPDGSRFSMPEMTITMESGASNNLQRIMLSMSKDGGVSFGPVYPKDLPNFGRRTNRVRFFQLGAANDVTFKWQFWDGNQVPPTPPIQDQINPTSRFVILGGTLRVQQ